MKIDYFAISDVGCKRPNNEDIILVDGKFLRDEKGDGSVEIDAKSRFAAIVADGMGGTNGGEFASDIAAQEFDTWVANLPEGLSLRELKAHANDFALATHTLINQRGEEIEGFYGMGTTLVGLFFYENQAYWINIGDSRIYIIRDGMRRLISRDHSMRNLLNDPNQPSNLIYNCLGSGSDDIPFADCDNLPLFENDRIVICSDGLTDMVDDELLCDMATVEEMIEAAKQAGGNDNISVVILDVA